VSDICDVPQAYSRGRLKAGNNTCRILAKIVIGDDDFHRSHFIREDAADALTKEFRAAVRWHTN
jgi:hypothetical protein